MNYTVRIILNQEYIYLYINGELFNYDIQVKSAWLINQLYKSGYLDPMTDLLSDLAVKYSGFDKVPTIPDFIDNDMKLDEKFRWNLDIKHLLLVDPNFKAFKDLHEVENYLDTKYKRKPKRIKDFLK